MRRIDLGNTGLTVSRLCFGTGTTGFNCQSVQSLTPVTEFGAVLRRAYDLGITFWDTSDDYGTHTHVRHAMQGLDRAQLTITSKTWASNARDARASVERSLREIGTDYLDILLMHEVDSPEEFEARQGALEALHQAKRDGLVRAVGLSTHAILTLELVAGDPSIDVLLTNYNKAELHMDAGLHDYSAALQKAHAAGQGVVVMKTLAEGRLSHDVPDALRFNLSKPFIHSVTVGMRDLRELEEIAALAEQLDPVPTS